MRLYVDNAHFKHIDILEYTRVARDVYEMRRLIRLGRHFRSLSTTVIGAWIKK